MKNQILMITRTTRFAVTCLLFLLIGGCASTDSENQESLLSAAGFRAHTPQTPAQQQVFEDLPPYKVQRVTANDKTIYVYKDEKQGVAYVGDPDEYQRYKELAVQQDIATDYYQAAAMNRQASVGWYGAWGPGYYW